ncbi:VWA domain-containing protein [Pelagicoccus sp. SDUM812002]|uniref:vWA domain-containing protein n=1 Tax=Pelagicoccus sp. SDUM812002 TaxID=3041266 RepID=UPI00280ED712|nr:VWA domain-containing protein [Pelagicoccus sp. SDUM812002]MDQ8185994.1 VWA domain-containing protein [Pelagicoccus sp. SDUM812002]
MKNRHLLAFILGLAPVLLNLLGPTASAADATTPVALMAELDYAQLSAEGHDTAVLKVSLLPANLRHSHDRPPLNLAIVLDRSGSMNGTKIEMAKQAIRRAFQSLQPNDFVSIIAYNNAAKTLLPLTRVGNISNPRAYIDSIHADGGTAIYAGVNLGAAALRPALDDSAGINRILLLSDGLANEGPSNVSDFQLLGRSLAREGITVSTIGLGLGYNEDLMAGLSAAGQGNVYFVESAKDLPRIFDSELGDASSIIAQNAVIEVECLHGFEPIRIIGREGQIQGNRVTLNIKHLYAGQEKFALIEMRNPGGRANTTQEIATISTRYQDIDSDQTYAVQQIATTTFAPTPEQKEKSVNIDVQRQVVYNYVAIAQDEAVALADQGDLPAATATLGKLDDWITTNNAVWNDTEIEDKRVALESTTTTLENDGLDNRSRKEMRSSSYQTRSQQKSY